jgi:HAMP domain-containing protein
MAGIEKRYVEKEMFRRERTLQLQSDEIGRLNEEFKRLIQHVMDLKEHRVKAESLCQARIFDLKREISLIPTRTSIQKSQMVSSQTNAISACQLAHQNLFNKIRSEYEQKLSEISFSIEEEQTSVVSSIGSTRAKIAEVLGRKAQLQEARIQEKLEKINQQIAADRPRIAELQDAVDRIREEIQRDKQLLDIGPQEDINNIAREEEREEQNLLLVQANALAEEHQFRDSCRRDLEKLKSEMAEAQIKLGTLKHRVRETEVSENSDLQSALKERERLEEKRRKLIASKRNPRASVEGISRERTKQKDLVGQMGGSRRALNEALAERERLLNELRRLDFMLFGRSGKYQTKPKARHLNAIV